MLSLLLALWPQWEASQNAVLFSAEAITEVRLAGENVSEACQSWKEWNDKTRIMPGVFERRPGYGDINSHDNYHGLALGAVSCNTPELAQEIVAALSVKGWAFNDVPPHGYDIRGQLTPKDYVPIMIAAGYIPSPIDTIYASIDLCVGHVWNLKRTKMIIYENSEMPFLQRVILAPCIWRAKRMVDYVDAGCNYHGQESPHCIALKRTKGVWKWQAVEPQN